MSEPIDPAAIRAALAKATPGPWAIGAHIPGHEQVAWTDARAAEEGVAEWTISAPDPCPYQETANAELIVLLRNQAEALLDALAAEQAKTARVAELAHRFELVPRARLLGALTAKAKS